MSRVRGGQLKGSISYHWEEIPPDTPVLLHPHGKANVPLCARVPASNTDEPNKGVRNDDSKHGLLHLYPVSFNFLPVN